VRALTFAIADGGIISNEGRGYVLRRILRRAARHGRLLGKHEPFLYQIVEPLVEVIGDHYTEIKSKKSHIELVIKSEEEQFGRTLDTGLEIFDDIVRKIESSGSKVIPGAEVFRLYDTYGFPVDLTEVMARERGLQVDMTGFEDELGKQKERSRKGSMFGSMLVGGPFEIKRPAGMERFVGYDKISIDTSIGNIQFLADEVKVILQQTPFYAESGGQVGDKGEIFSNQFSIKISDTQKFNDEHIHIGKVIRGEIPDLYLGPVTAVVDETIRAEIKKNHTATHLLHRALRMALGEHVHQAGSLVAPDRLRFDFTHFKAMTPEEIDRVEQIVREKIDENLPVKWENMNLGDAKKLGAMALFGEKYGEVVRVVTTGEPPSIFSMELCGGTHVNHTAEIGDFFMTQETAIAAGMRRIEALSGNGAAKIQAEQNEIVSKIREYLKKDVDILTEDDISKFKTLVGSAHRRILHKQSILNQIENFQARFEKGQRQKRKEDQGKLSAMAREVEPVADLDGGKLKLFVFGDNQNAKLYADIFSAQNPDATVAAISGSTGTFAIKSPDYGSSQSVFEDMREFGARGGGKPTISGSIPKDKIEAFIGKVRKKFK
jgi:alanyl-tRNA synthetase